MSSIVADANNATKRLAVRWNRAVYKVGDAECCMFCAKSLTVDAAIEAGVRLPNHREGKRYCKSRLTLTDSHSYCQLFKKRKDGK